MKSLFSQSGQVLAFRQFLRLLGNFFVVSKTLFGPFLVIKTNVSMPWFQCKIGLKTGHPRPRYLRKNKMGLQFGFACHVLQTSRHRVVRFSNQSFHWNRGIETVVLSTIIGTNGVFKYPKFFPASFKNHLKNPKLRENLTGLGKKVFHLGISDS